MLITQPVIKSGNKDILIQHYHAYEFYPVCNKISHLLKRLSICTSYPYSFYLNYRYIFANANICRRRSNTEPCPYNYYLKMLYMTARNNKSNPAKKRMSFTPLNFPWVSTENGLFHVHSAIALGSGLGVK